MGIPIRTLPTRHGYEKTYYHRGKLHPEHIIGGIHREVECPYFSKIYSARGKLLMHIELSPKKGNRDMEIRPRLLKEDTPRAKWAKALLKMKWNMAELRLQCKKSPISISTTNKNDARRTTSTKTKERKGQWKNTANKTHREDSRPAWTRERIERTNTSTSRKNQPQGKCRYRHQSHRSQNKTNKPRTLTNHRKTSRNRDKKLLPQGQW